MIKHILVILFFISVLLSPVQASSIVLLNSSTFSSLQSSVSFLESQNATISHRYPPNILIGTIPTNITHPNISLITSQRINTTLYPNHSRIIIESWNKNIISPSPYLSYPSYQYNPIIPNDSFIKPSSIQSANTPNQSLIYGASFTDLSEYFIGSISVGILFPESINNTEDWTEEEEINVISEIRNGLDWWISKEPNANISFTYDIHYKIPVSSEPITLPADFYGSTGQAIWISDIMSYLNFTNLSDYYENTIDYDNYIRNQYSTDWVFTIFIVDSSNDTDGKFLDNYFAYASVGGPFLVMTYDNNGYSISNLDAVVAHETGHIFYANDQYANAQRPCTQTSGYLNIENQNSELNCLSNVPSIMRGGITPFTLHQLDPYARQQLGWKDSNNNSVLDIIDFPPTTIYLTNLTFITTTTSTLPSLNPASFSTKHAITINKIKSIYYSINNSSYTPINISFPTNTIIYSLPLPTIPGNHTVSILSQNTASITNITLYNYSISYPIITPSPTPIPTKIPFISSLVRPTSTTPPMSVSVYRHPKSTVPPTIEKHEILELPDAHITPPSHTPIYLILFLILLISLITYLYLKTVKPLPPEKGLNTQK